MASSSYLFMPSFVIMLWHPSHLGSPFFIIVEEKAHWTPERYLEHAELFLDINSLVHRWKVFQDIETYSLRERAALADRHDISFTNSIKSWRAVDSNILMTFLVPSVFAHIVQIISADNDGTSHLCGNNKPLQDSASDSNISCEWALFVDIVAFSGVFGRFET
mmetsp:Transcript_18995/g.25035  ORF Transcript_18995/g.25035 Transcript_18995/m.25035 type:complete len:163 (-) Transcript_18995:207-695(-)